MKQPKQRKPRHKLLILLLLVLGCVAVLATGTYAAYTEFASVNFVAVANTDSSDALRFSSNLLSDYSDMSEDYITRPVSVNPGQSVEIGITVCNYPHNLPAFVNSSQIAYTIKAEPFELGTSKVSVTSEALSENDIYSLTGGIKSENLHTLTVTLDENADLSAGYIEVVVLPTSETAAAVQNRILAARLKLIPTAAGETPWKGEFILSGNDYKNNDAINYHIYGTEECVMVLEWDPNVVTLGKWSKKLLGVNEEGNPGSLDLSLGGLNKPTSYLLQFYRLQPAGESKSELGINFRSK